MFTVALVSAVGGSGRTTLTAALARAISERGRPVLAVDCDPQNLLRVHCGLRSEDPDGWARRALHGGLWGESAYEANGLRFLPFGRFDEAARASFESRLRGDSGWLARRLAEIEAADDLVVLIDAPRVPSAYAALALGAANLTLGVLRADLASCETLPALMTWVVDEARPAFYVINRFDATRPLQRQAQARLRTVLRKRLLPTLVHRDEALVESLAACVSLTANFPHSQAAHDVQSLATWLLGRVPAPASAGAAK